MPIINENETNGVNPTFPEVVVVEKTPSPSVRTTGVSAVGMVFQTTRGNVGEIYEIGSLNEFVKTFGGYLEGLDGYLSVKRFFDAGGSLIHGVRVASGEVVKATVNLLGVSTGTVFSLTADTGGTWGNLVQATVKNNAVTGYFDLSIQNGSEVISYVKASTLSTDSRYIKKLIDADSNSFFDITMTLTNGTMPVTGTFTLTGGTNGTVTGSNLADSAYVGTDNENGRTGIEKFREDEEVIMVGSARMSDTINTALATHVGLSDVTPRRTILTFTEGATPTNAISTASSIVSDKVQFWFNRVKVRNPFTSILETVSPTEILLAMDSKLDYHISKSQLNMPSFVEGVERTLTLTEQKKFADNNINAITVKKGKGIYCTSDFTRDNNPSKTQNAHRKAKDYLGINIEKILLPFISKPITNKLWEDIKNTLENFLDGEFKLGRIGIIGGGKPFNIKLDSDNNPVYLIRQNRVAVEIAISLLALADKIFAYVDADANNVNVTI